MEKPSLLVRAAGLEGADCREIGILAPSADPAYRNPELRINAGGF